MKTTFRSKILSILALLLLATPAYATSSVASGPQSTASSATTTPAPVPNASSPAHIALAKAYVDSAGIDDDIKAAVEDMSQRVKEDQRVLFRSIADKTIDYNKLKAAAVVQVSNLFTDEEIKAMTTFFGSAEGKSIRKKLPIYEAGMQPAVTDVLKVFVVKLKENNVSVDVNGTGSL